MREDSNAEFFLRTQALQEKTGIAARRESEHAIRLMMKPEKKPKDNAQGERNRKKTAGFWHSDEGHSYETEHDDQPDGMASELSTTVRPKRNDAGLCGHVFARPSPAQ